MLNSILSNLADNFPQAAATGGSLRMKEVINQVDRVQDEENDLIFANGLKISDYLSTQEDPNGNEQLILEEEGDYTQFVMKVINTAISVTQSTENDSRERTIKEKFTDFNEQLFWIAQQKEYHNVINTVIDEDSSVQTKGSRRLYREATKNIVQYFDQIVDNKGQKQLNLARLSRKETLMSENEGLDLRASSEGNEGVMFQRLIVDLQRVMLEKEDSLELMKR
jgi:hypothetical protein